MNLYLLYGCYLKLCLFSVPCGGRCCANAYCNPKDNRCYCNEGYYGIPTLNCYSTLSLLLYCDSFVDKMALVVSNFTFSVFYSNFLTSILVTKSILSPEINELIFGC